jgi:hypothetical protein
MNADWQNMVALALAAIAVVYVIYRLWGINRGKQRTGCGSCSACPEPEDPSELVSIDPPSNSNLRR